jgi:hypothetical protein
MSSLRDDLSKKDEDGVLSSAPSLISLDSSDVQGVSSPLYSYLNSPSYDKNMLDTLLSEVDQIDTQLLHDLTEQKMASKVKAQEEVKLTVDTAVSSSFTDTDEMTDRPST